MKRSKIVLICILAIAILISISGTYARYMSVTKLKAQMELANWLIKVNTTDITLEETKEFSISDLTYSTNPNVKVDKFAPGSEITFTIAIDGTESMVSMDYDLTIDLSNFNNPNVKVKDVESTYGTVTHKDGEDTYHGLITYSKTIPQASTLTVTLKWESNEDHLDEDNALGLVPLKKITVPVKVVVNQHVKG